MNYWLVKSEPGAWSWDDHFNSSGELGPWHEEDRTVWAVATEVNDYFRSLPALICRAGLQPHQGSASAGETT